MLLASHGILPGAVVLPVAALAVLVVAAHLSALRSDAGVPISRRRLRTASGAAMLVTTVVLSYAFTAVRPDDPVRFTIAWTGAIMLLVVVLALAGLDAINNVRLARIHRRRVRDDAGHIYAQIADAIARARAERGQDDPAAHGQPTPQHRAGQEDA